MSNYEMTQHNKSESPPYPYSQRPTGLYQLVPTKDGDAEEEWLCSDLLVLGTGSDSNGKSWGRLIELKNPDDVHHRLFLPMAEISGSGSRVLATLNDHGLHYASGKIARDGILHLLRVWEGPNKYLVTRRMGWASRSCDSFILDASTTLGSRKVFYIGETTGGSHGLSTRGTIGEWRNDVAKKCIGNPILLSALSLAFCGPLLDVLEIDGFGLHLRGSSSCGKSTALNAATSVWGAPERMSSWRTTANALEGTATRMNSTLLALDELGQVSGKEAFDAAYTLGNGQGKRRANASGHSVEPMNWRVPILSSGEITLAEKIAESGRKIMLGQEVRIIDVAADTGRFGIFDDIHEAASAAIFSENLKASAKRTYGVAGTIFVEGCLRNRATLRDTVQRQLSAQTRLFLSTHPEPLDGPLQRVAGSFALIAIAGELASLWDATGWPSGSATDAAAKLFEAWADQHSANKNAAETVWVPKLNDFLSRELNRGISPMGPDALSSTFGFFDDGFVYLNDDAWCTAFGSNNQSLAAKELAGAGVLLKDGKHNKAKIPRGLGDRRRLYRLRGAALDDRSTVIVGSTGPTNLATAA